MFSSNAGNTEPILSIIMATFGKFFNYWLEFLLHINRINQNVREFDSCDNLRTSTRVHSKRNPDLLWCGVDNTHNTPNAPISLQIGVFVEVVGGGLMA